MTKTDNEVSQQSEAKRPKRKWAEAQRARGRCIICAKKAVLSARGGRSQYCAKHRIWYRNYMREYMRSYNAALCFGQKGDGAFSRVLARSGKLG